MDNRIIAHASEPGASLSVLLAEYVIDCSHLRARISDLEAERDSYALLAKQALHALHDVTVERDVLRGQRRLNRQRERGELQRAA